MRIEPFQNSFDFTLAAMQKAVMQPTAAQSAAFQTEKPFTQASGIVVEISQEAKNYAQKLEEIQKMEGCQTCKNRRYVDESGDSTVSYQSPTKITPSEAAGRVMAHEQEHVTNEKARAEQNDRKVVSLSVSLSTSICPECGKPYVSGGTTRVITAGNNKPENPEMQKADETRPSG